MLLETIKISEGKIHNLPYHQARCERSRTECFGCTTALNLEAQINAPTHGLWRCRIIYAEHIRSIEYLPYQAKSIHSLKIVSSSLDYSHKYTNRDALHALVLCHPSFDDILIEKEGLLTDISMANIAFYDGEHWQTPHVPLLKGTMREKLLDEGFLHEKDIRVQDLNHYKQVALMNAMLGFNILKDIQIEDSKGNTYDY